MTSLVPPVVDYSTHAAKLWPTNTTERWVHIGIIVSKTGHDRGQKEMYLYSPTVKRHDGLIVCSSDFLHFEVGEWILFQATKAEVYMSGLKFPDPYPTNIQFDKPRMTKVRACMYPSEKYSTYSLVCRKQTQRCWSPDLGDLFIDGSALRSRHPIISEFSTDSGHLYYVTAIYHFNASVFHEVGGVVAPEEQRKVYWIIDSIDGLVEDKKDVADFALAPWRNHVWAYLEHRRRKGDESNSVPPWYTRSARILTYDMISMWEGEAMKNLGKNHRTPLPVIVKDDGETVVAHPSELFHQLKESKQEFEKYTAEDAQKEKVSKYSWKSVMSHDGQMLEPGSLYPPVSTIKKQVPGRVELVQDSAGLFMSKDAALSYVEIKEQGTNKLWTTGGWKNPGEAWDGNAARTRWDKNVNRVDEIAAMQDPAGVIRCGQSAASKNLMLRKAPPKKKTGADSTDSSPQRTSSSLSAAATAQAAAIADSTPPSAKAAKAAKFSFASAAKIHKKPDEEVSKEEKKASTNWGASFMRKKSPAPNASSPPTTSSSSAALLPLIPTGCASAEEATENFRAVFESRYGTDRMVPPFHIGSLESAIARSSDAPDGPGRPLALYIHHDSSDNAESFPKEVLCDDWVLHLLQSEYILWAWDVTMGENREKLIEWLNEHSLTDVATIVTSSLLSIDFFPLLVLVTVERGQLKMIDYVYGRETPIKATKKMRACMETYAAAKEGEAKMLQLYEQREEKKRQMYEANEAAKKELYEKYIRLKEYLRGAEAEANKQPEMKGFTPREYIKSQQDDIKIINLFVSMGIRADTEDARAEIASCHANIARVEQQLEDGDLMESELYKVHRTEKEDRECKEYLKGHVEIKKKLLENMRVQLLHN